MKHVPVALALFFLSFSLRADVPANNFWHNPTFEVGDNLDLPGGLPEFWLRGGSDTSITQVTTANAVSPTHALVVNDPGPGFGEWFSDFTLAGSANVGDILNLHWHEIYTIDPGNEMRVTVRLLNSGGNGPDNHFVVTGNSPGWTGSFDASPFVERNQQLLVPSGAVTLRIQLASGGPENGAGVYLLDDLSVTVIPEPRALLLLLPLLLLKRVRGFQPAF